MDVFFYDRDPFNGAERLYKISKAIEATAPKKLGLKLTNCCRPRRFGAEPGADEQLLVEISPYPFHAVIVHISAADSEHVIGAALTGLEYNGLPLSRLIILDPLAAEPYSEDKGVQRVPARSGNGYLENVDVGTVLQLLSELNGT